MRSGTGPSGLKVFAAAVVAVTVGLAATGCTGDNAPGAETTPSSASSSAAGPSMTFEEAYRKVPMDGTKDLPITWDLAGAPDTGEVLAARRSLAYNYWLDQATDWTPIIPIGRFVYTEEFNEKFLAPYATTTSDDPLVGPIWVKVMGVEQTGPDQARVTFCTDLGYWHHAQTKDAEVRAKRGTVQSYVMENVESGDGERHWLADRMLDPDVDRQAKYGTACTKWAQHQP
ncbi:hypothetical protein [Actinoplanes regularis]|uniref:hypothetical protein n=1 Tax=Actinoplanes regularis TaxID=52697 RepID=UPI0024A526FF|nr:hypothetical protein [Actinoplanes regularis]GLW32524.1 hypothetical protein Areg01_54620 [Actinoplanes regularis]